MLEQSEVRRNSDGSSLSVLTCKSFVWFEYRGERLIEPS